VRWICFPLHPETPLEGQTLEDMFAGRGVDIPALIQRLQGVARDLGLPFGDRKMTFNSRRAQELGKWAETQGKGEEFHLAMFQAYFRDGLNIADLEVLAGVCRDLGLDPEQARRVLAEESFAAQVDEDWAYSRQVGVSAVPTFKWGEKTLVGAQPYSALAKMVEEG